MESRHLDQIRHATNTDIIRRLLIKYFIDKGYDGSFDRQVYPANIQDLTQVIPILSNKIEIIPHAVDIDTSLGRAVLGWNMFLLGGHRMFLGETYHNSLHDLAREIRNNSMTSLEVREGQSVRTTTPRKIITFITRVLGDNKAGYIDLTPASTVKEPGQAYVAKQTLNALPSQLFSNPTS